MIERKTVYIYFDEGVSSSGVRHLVYSLSKVLPPNVNISTIDHIGVANPIWMEHAILFIMPGGRDKPYQKNLSGKGINHIKSYVENGGNYLGICAGAYFGCREIVFEKGSPLEIEEKRDLGFFPGKAIGTIYPDKTFHYFLTTGVKASQIQYKEEILHTYYNGGCYFLADDQNHYPLASYLDTSFSSPLAIVKCPVGKGIAILSGVHIEYSTALYPPNLLSKDDLQKLLVSEKKRWIVFQDILQELAF
ncbi:MAG: hypothetical protein HY860_02740 [Chlamydiales bacterium]|nr:hypothetical protein [Chlamydiales bacterium]